MQRWMEYALALPTLPAEEQPMPIEPKRPYVNAQQVATYLSLSLSTVRRMTGRKEIPHVKLGRRVVYSLDHLDAWLTAQTIEPSATGED